MNQAPTALDPWRLVWGQPYIDSRTLAAAIEQDLAHNADPDFRTRLLVRDSAVALRSYWGSRRFAQWLTASPVGAQVREIINEELGEPGYTTIRRRLVDSIDSTQLSQIFELLGRSIHGRIEIHIAGSVPTLIKGLTARPTDDIDLVDEVPAEIRRQRDALRKIETEFGLKLGHVQSHYLPVRWRDRRKWLGDFGGLRVYVLDEYDIFVSKLSSQKDKHQLDLRVLALKLDKDTARHRLLNDGRAFLDDPKLRPQIEENWRFIFQEPLFSEPEGEQAGEGDRVDQAPDETPPSPGRPKRSRPKRRKPD
jgi:Nucleotidyltransferase of unknown function (DUF6036)